MGWGRVLPGSAGHAWIQGQLYEGRKLMWEGGSAEVLGHEQQTFLAMEGGRWRMSPTDTLVWAVGWEGEDGGFGILDYKFVEDVGKYAEDASWANREQVNLYAWGRQAKWYALVYVSKLNYLEMIVHRYETSEGQARASVKRMQWADGWVAGERPSERWLGLATGRWDKSYGKNGYRYICEPNKKGTYAGCPNRAYCLGQMARAYGVSEIWATWAEFDAWASKARVRDTPEAAEKAMRDAGVWGV